MPVLVDFESRSRADLKRVGGRNYWQHPTTEALCAVLYDTCTGEVGAWVPGMPCPITPDTLLAAHNARGFDRFAAEKYEWPAISLDTSEAARRAGLPGALEALATRWLGLEKDKVGRAFTLSLSRPSRAKARLGMLPDLTADVMARVVAYCASDVEVMAHGWERLEPWLDIPWENDVSRVDRIVNDRGIAFDSALAQALIRVCDSLAGEALELAASHVGETADRLREIVMSPEQFVDFTGLDNAQAEIVERVLAMGDDGDAGVAYWACFARQAIASIARGKLEAGLARVSPDGRLRDMHRYIGAHTWRWSGSGMQLQNMPRPDKRFETWTDDDICRAADAVLAGGTCDAETVDLLLRATLTGDHGSALAVCDFAGVEARANAWAAGDSAALDVFASGVSPYKVMAGVIFGVSPDDVSKGNPMYDVGKIAELACGYGMGGNKFGWTAAKAGADLIAMGIDGAEVVDAWRKKHAPIVRFWRELEAALLGAVRGELSRVACFDFVPSDDGRDVAIFLPSGRPIVYPETREGLSDWGKPEVSYLGALRGREHLYGGKICENVIQAFCRDLMADALVRAEDAGLEPVLHVHDEIVCARGTYEDIRRIMLQLPEWAEGFPIGAAGHEGARYRK